MNKADRNQAIWELFCADVPTKEIAKQFNLSLTMIRAIIKHQPDYDQVLREKHYQKYSVDRIKALIQAGKNKTEIGRELGLSRMQLKYAFLLFPELSALYGKKPIKPDHDKDRAILWEMYQAGATYRQMGKAIGRSKQYIEQRLYEYPLYEKRSVRAEAKRTRIRLLRLEGLSLTEIAEKTSMNPRDVGKVLRYSQKKLKRL